MSFNRRHGLTIWNGQCDKLGCPNYGKRRDTGELLCDEHSPERSIKLTNRLSLDAQRLLRSENA
jgi:hypothetical protein